LLKETTGAFDRGLNPRLTDNKSDTLPFLDGIENNKFPLKRLHLNRKILVLANLITGIRRLEPKIGSLSCSMV